MELSQFIKTIPDFDKIASAAQIDYFVYYLIFEKHLNSVKPKDVQLCFNTLHLQPYSNIPNYLNRLSQRGKQQKFLKRGVSYVLENGNRVAIESNLKRAPVIDPSDNLFPIEIFNNTRGYLMSFAKEACASYDFGLYSACFFMLRKLLETLIIEMFEKHNLESKIKSPNGGYFFLSDLIAKLINESAWHLTKIVREEIPKIKKLADSSVHSKRFTATKSDIDNIKTDIRIILQEFINHIDYPTWKSN